MLSILLVFIGLVFGLKSRSTAMVMSRRSVQLTTRENDGRISSKVWGWTRVQLTTLDHQLEIGLVTDCAMGSLTTLLVNVVGNGHKPTRKKAH